jgi:DNA mismatch repair ATPase MutS
MFTSATSGKLNIDRRTAANLELISNARSGNQKESLFGAIDHTKTVVGARLLRSNILRPSTGTNVGMSLASPLPLHLYFDLIALPFRCVCLDIATINTRLDLVESFLR